MRKLFSLFFLLVMWHITTYAQSFCGTRISQDEIRQLSTLLQTKHKTQDSWTDDTISVPILAHIIRNSDGTGGIDENIVAAEIDSVNSFFIHAGVQFKLCQEVNYIDDSRFTIIGDADSDESILTSSTAKARVINIYFADQVNVNGNQEVCGYTYLAGGPLHVFVSSQCLTSIQSQVRGNTLTHELGHTFSLIHTHGESNDQRTEELVNGANCATTGDMICDTPADPNLDGKVCYNPICKCEYVGNEKDENGQLYQPPVENIMSYTFPLCSREFSPQQYAQMRETAFIYGYNDLLCPVEGPFLETGITKIYPNPFSSSIGLEFTLRQDSKVKISLWNIMGQRMEVLLEEDIQKGYVKKTFPIHASKLEEGIYFIMLTTGEQQIKGTSLFYRAPF